MFIEAQKSDFLISNSVLHTLLYSHTSKFKLSSNFSILNNIFWYKVFSTHKYLSEHFITF